MFGRSSNIEIRLTVANVEIRMANVESISEFANDE
jgi:hypothetical protein